MKTSFNWYKTKPTLNKIFILAAVAMLLFSQNVFADTAANTRIINTVIVHYSDALGGNATQSTPVSVSVTVVLVPAEPTLTVTTAPILTAYQNVTYTLEYAISANANGEDTYDLLTVESVASANLDDPTFTINLTGDSISLGGTTLAANVSAGATTITVPYDATGTAGLVNGIAADEWIVVDGDTAHPCQVQTITHDSASNTTDIQLYPATPIFADTTAGVIIGEYAEFTVDVLTNVLTSGNFDTYTIRTTAASATDGALIADQLPGDSLITVRLFSLNVSKFVRNLDNTTGSTPSYNFGGNVYFSSDVEGIEGNTLEYIVVVENPAGASLATNVIIEDAIPQFTSYVDGSMSLDGSAIDQSVNGDAGRYDSATNTVYIYAGNTPGTDDGTGGTLTESQTTVGQFRVTID
jgi:uncharacterized repeat protein (TIGR01451 family)